MEIESLIAQATENFFSNKLKDCSDVTVQKDFTVKNLSGKPSFSKDYWINLLINWIIYWTWKIFNKDCLLVTLRTD